jgi:hypothetical protein
MKSGLSFYSQNIPKISGNTRNRMGENNKLQGEAKPLILVHYAEALFETIKIDIWIA